MTRDGKCMCGAVSYTAAGLTGEISACHCEMCRRWTGGPLLAATAKTIAWRGEEHIRTFTSSAWAERGFCTQCGSALFYRVTAEGPHHGMTTLAFGTLDDQAGFAMSREWFIDKKPEVYEFAGERAQVTGAEAMALFSGSE